MQEQLILSNLIWNEEYTRKTIPYIDEDYFSDTGSKIVFKVISDYIKDYNKNPTKEAVAVEIDSLSLVENVHDSAISTLNSLSAENSDLEWLLDRTEKWCQDRSLYNAIMKAVQIYDGKDKNLSRGSLPQLLTDALAVSFETTIGHDYVDNWKERYDHYHEKKNRIPFDIELLNKITGGGVFSKTLNCVLGGTGSGKTMNLCHFAASYISQGKNVLYITLEMSEEEISKRIDANLMGIDIKMIDTLPFDSFKKKIDKIKDKNVGKLIVKEYPTTTANANHFRHLLSELNLKKKFKPDIIIIDYINICASARFKPGAHNSYTIVKAIAEEIRGLAIEFDVPIWTATQSTRSANGASDIDITEVSECVYVNENVNMLDGSMKKIGEIKLGDKVLSHDHYKVVCKRHHNKMKDCIKITTKSGKSIIISKDHKFPIKDSMGNIKRISYNEGLKVGDLLSVIE